MEKKGGKEKRMQSPRGMRDRFGRDLARKKEFFRQASNLAEHYGFQEVETPILEHREVFEKGVGEGTDIVDKEMYTLTTTGGDELVLRPEGTAAMVRVAMEHGFPTLPQPQMWYYAGPFFRHEKPQKGRYRQFDQFGAELMGSENPAHDALVIQLGYEILRLSGRGILVELNTLGTAEERRRYVEELQSFYREHMSDLGEKDRERVETNPLRILDSKDEGTRKVNERAPQLMDYLGEESRAFFEKLKSYLEALSIPYQVVPSLVRGLDYYAHTVFEYVTREGDEKSLALGGGGRYDGLAEILGSQKPIPAVGFALGVDRILELSDPQRFSPEEKLAVYVVSLGERAHREALRLVRELQNLDCRCFLPLSDQKLGKQLEKAEKLGYEHVIILGDNEVERGVVQYKHLPTRKQEEVSLENLFRYLEQLE